MTDFSVIRLKITDLKAKILDGSVTPASLGTLLDEIVDLISATDTTSACQSLSTSLTNLSKSIPSQGVLSGEVRELEPYGDVIFLPVVIHKPDGSTSVHRYTIPGATVDKAGLYDVATRQAVAEGIANAQNAAAIAQNTADAAIQAASDAAALAENTGDSITDRIGRPSGIAPLDSGGKVPADYLPSYVDDVVEFGGRIPSVAMWMALDATKEQAEAGTVVFVNVECRFALCVDGTKYYRRWPGQEAYGTEATAGIMPVKGKMYVDTSENRQYRWSGSGFAEMGAPTPIGTEEGEAFPGPDGLQLRRDLNKHLAELSATALTQGVLAGAGVPIEIAGEVSTIKYRALAIDLPAGRTYEVATLAKNVARIDLRVVHTDGSITWLVSHLSQSKTVRFTPDKDVAWIGLDAFGDTNATVTLDSDFVVTASLVIKAVDTVAENDEAAARRLDAWAAAHTAANAGAAWTKKALAKGRVALCLDDLSTIQGPFVDAAISAGVPLTLAAIPERLGVTLDDGQTGLELCRKVLAARGEIASHHTTPLTPSSTADDWHSYFVTSRLELEKAGLKATGIVKAGGASADDEAALDKTMLAGYLKAYYTHGIGFSSSQTADPRYNDWRRSLGAYTYDEFEAELSRVAANKSAIVFYTHCNDIIKDNDSTTHLNKFIEMLGILNRFQEDGTIELTTLKGCTLNTLDRND